VDMKKVRYHPNGCTDCVLVRYARIWPSYVVVVVEYERPGTKNKGP
jgi:hypothetical protein